MKKLILAAALSLAGCVTPPTKEQMAAADYGPQPDGEAVVRSYLKMVLKDPDSLKDLIISPLYKCYRQTGGMTDAILGANYDKAATHYGWCAKVSYNAKNSYGGYVGAKPYDAFFKDGTVSLIEHFGQ